MVVVLCACRMWRSYFSTVGLQLIDRNNVSMSRLLLRQRTPPRIYLRDSNRVTPNVSGIFRCVVRVLFLCLLQILYLKHLGTMTDTRVTSVIATYQQHTTTKQSVPSTTYGRSTLGASGVPNKLFIVFLFSEHDVDVQFLKDVRLG